MKQLLYILYLLVGVFFVMAFKLLPEYSIRILLASILYCFFFVLIFKETIFLNIKRAILLLKSKRIKFLLPVIFFFFSLIIFSYFLLKQNIFSSYDFYISSNNVLRVSDAGKKYLAALEKKIEVIYIKPLKGNDISELLSAMMQEYNRYSTKIKFRIVHPVLDSIDYNELKTILPTVSEGKIIILSDNNRTIIEHPNEYELLSAFYRVIVGKTSVCTTKGHKEPKIDDYNENGSAITAQILEDKGIFLDYKKIDNLDNCSVLLINDPKTEFSQNEIIALNKYNGKLIILGGMKLTSIKDFLKNNGIQIIDKKLSSFSSLSNRQYNNGLLISPVIKHPLLNNISDPIVVSDASPILCNDCKKLAAISSSLSDIVFVSKGRLFMFSGASVGNNFFMRYKGNSEFLYNIISYSISPSSLFDSSLIESSSGLVVISQDFLNIISMLVIMLIPFIAIIPAFFAYLRKK